MAEGSIFRSDKDGFLTGTSISNQQIIDEWEAIRESLSVIEKGVSSIEKALKIGGRTVSAAELKQTVAEPLKRAIKDAAKSQERAARPNNRTETEKHEAKRERVRKETRREDREYTRRTETKKAAREQTKAVAENVQTVTAEPKKKRARKTTVTAVEGAPSGVSRRTERANATSPSRKREKPTEAIAEAAAEKAVSKAAKIADKPAEPKNTRQKRTPATSAEAEALGVKNGRDAKGRFVKGEGKTATGGGEGNTSNASLGVLAEKVAEAAKGAAETVGEADPTVTAVEEIAEPISRGYSFLQNAWGDSEESGWLRKILKSIGKFRKDQSTFNKAEKKTLEGIEDNTEGGAAEAGGFNLPFIGKLPALLPALTTFGKKIPFIGSAIAGIAGLFGVLDSEWDNTTSREEKDRRTGKAIGGAGGAIGGMFAGAKAGALMGSFFGPIGTAIGGVLGTAVGGFFGTKAGDIIGETVGGWVADLRSVNIPEFIAGQWAALTESVQSTWLGFIGSIKTNWNQLTQGFQKTWDSVFGGLADFWDNAKNALSQWIKAKTGIDVSAIGETVSDKVSGAFDSVKSFFSFGSKEPSPVLDSMKNEQSDGWKLGETSALFESGNRGAATISSGRGDAGGASYGTYQLSSRAGTLQSFLKNSGYAKDFEGMKAGTAEFDAKWRELARNNPAFGEAQHDFVKATHYDKAIAGLSESGIDLSKRGKAVQDAIWSTSVQFGAGSAKSKNGAVPMFKKALEGRDVSRMSDTEIVTAIQDYKLANNDKFFRSSSSEVRRGTARRAVEEKKRLVALAQSEENSPANTVQGARTLAAAGLAPEQKPVEIGSFLDAAVGNGAAREKVAQATMLAQTASPAEAVAWTANSRPDNAAVASLNVPSFKTPAIQAAQAAQAASVVTPLASNRQNAPTVVKIEQDAGQDVRDRAVAHIVTGGLAK